MILSYKNNMVGFRSDINDLNKNFVLELRPFRRIKDIRVTPRNFKWYSFFDINLLFVIFPEK